jgi:ribosomal protein L11 methyltransferase
VAHLGAAGVLLREGAVSAYFEEGEAEAKAAALKGYLAALRLIHPGAALRLGRYRLKTADWASGWKKHFRPLRIGRRLVVRPSWRRYQTKPGDVVIEIDPGQAFGTGAHASTSLALEAIEELAADQAGRDGSALDLGTGTGILAIALARLGWERVVAVDIDPDATSAARENMARNGVAERVAVLEGGPEALNSRFGLIAANLSRPDLLRLRPEMARLAQSGGVLVFSGMLDEHVPEVEAAYLAAGFSLRRLLPGGGWSCLILEAPK